MAMVTIGAAFMPTSERSRDRDLRRTFDPVTLMTSGTRLTGGLCIAVRPMTIQALIYNGSCWGRTCAMLQVDLVMAARARLCRHGLVPMRLVTRKARLIGVNGDRRMIALWRMMTAQTILWTLEIAGRAAHVRPQLHGLGRFELMAGNTLLGLAGVRVVGRQIVTRHAKLSRRTSQLFTGGIVTLRALESLLQVQRMPR